MRTRPGCVRVIEYEVPDREGDGKDELIVLVTTITDYRQATAEALARAYHERWEHETGNAQLKTYLRGPGKVLRSGSPDTGRAGDLGLPAGPLRDQRPDLRRRHRGRASTRTGSSSSAPLRIVPPGRRPGFSPLSTPSACWPRSRPTSPARRTSTRGAGTGPAPASSNAAATTPTASRNPATRTPGTTARHVIRLANPAQAQTAA